MKIYVQLLIAFLMVIQSLNSQNIKPNNQEQTTAENFFTINKLARTYYERQKLDSALILAEKSLIQAEKEFGKNDSLYCNSLYLLFDIYFDKGDFNKSIEYCLLEKDLRKKLKGEKHPQYATSLGNLGLLYKRTGKFDLAEPLYIEALNILKETKGVKHSEYWLTLINNLAQLYMAMGNYSASEPLQIEGLKIAKQQLGTKKIDYAISLNNLAELYRIIGNFSAAEPLYIEAIQINKELFGEKHSTYAISLSNLALFYFTIGNYKAAEPLYLEALKINKDVFGEKHYNYSISLVCLGVLYYKTGNFQESERLYIEALKVLKNVLGEKHPNYATFLNNLAVLYTAMLNYNAAETLQIQAMNIRKEALGEKHPDYAISLNNLAELYRLKGNYNTAEPLYEKALEIRKEIFGLNHMDYIESLNNLAVIKSKLGKYDISESLFLKTIDAIKENNFLTFNFLSEKEKELYFKKWNNNFSNFYSFALKRKEQSLNISSEVYNSVITNKGLLLKSSTAMRSFILASSDTTLKKLYSQWSSLKKEISKLNSSELSKRKKDPEILEKQANDLEKELVKRYSALGDINRLQNLKWLDVKKSLKKGEAAIEFIHFKEGEKNDSTTYCALIINHKSIHPEMVKLFDEKDLIKILGAKSETSESYITGIYGKRNITNTQLYDLIWKPLETNLKGVKTIYYSPTGLLHKISFATLSKSKDSYLCDNYRLELKGSTANIATTSNFDFNDHPNFCVFGDIQYDTPETLRDTTALITWPYLEGTKIESEKVVSILRSSNLNTDYINGKNATEAEFKIKAPLSNVVHVATHGFFFPDPDAYSYIEKQDSSIKETRAYRGGEKAVGIYNFVINKNPLMRSGLVFAGANEVWVREEGQEKEDGVVTAQEVANLDLRNTNLVVLSACETGLGDIKGTEGVYGLQRSLKMAGVKYVIMSLWQVPDAETVEFMHKFYTKFVRTKSIKSSFYETQNEMRKKYDPFYWAAFVLLE